MVRSASWCWYAASASAPSAATTSGASAHISATMRSRNVGKYASSSTSKIWNGVGIRGLHNVARAQDWALARIPHGLVLRCAVTFLLRYRSVLGSSDLVQHNPPG